MTKLMKTLHGGVAATTVNNVIHYIAPAELGNVITAKTEIMKAGRSLINVQFDLWNPAKKEIDRPRIFPQLDKSDAGSPRDNLS